MANALLLFPVEASLFARYRYPPCAPFHAQTFVYLRSLPPAIDPLPLSARSPFPKPLSNHYPPTPTPVFPARRTQLTPTDGDSRVDTEAKVVTLAPDDLASLFWVSVVLVLPALLLAQRLCLPRCSCSWSGGGGGNRTGIYGTCALLARWLKPVRRPSR